MNERLKEFMQSEGLTSVKFAEIMEVQPSSISHLLSGRNYPNFDFLSKILLRFPSLNPDWIINGKGSIYRSKSEEVINTQANPVGDVTNVSDNEEVRTEGLVTDVITSKSSIDTGIRTLFDDDSDRDEPSYTSYSKDITSNDIVPDLLFTDVNNANAKTPLPASNFTDKGNESIPPVSDLAADRIVMFYADGTFKEYLKR